MPAHISAVGTMSSVAIFVTRSRMVERQPVGDAAAAIVAGDGEALRGPSAAISAIASLAITRLE